MELLSGFELLSATLTMKVLRKTLLLCTINFIYASVYYNLWYAYVFDIWYWYNRINLRLKNFIENQV